MLKVKVESKVLYQLVWSGLVHRWAVNSSVFEIVPTPPHRHTHTLIHTYTGARLLLAVKFNVNHRRSNFLHHVGNEVVFVSWAVWVVLSWKNNTHTHMRAQDVKRVKTNKRCTEILHDVRVV